MSLKLNKASAIAVAATLAVAVIGADSTGAAAQNNPVVTEPQDASQIYVSDPVVQTLPTVEANDRDDSEAQPVAVAQVSAGTLSQLVSNQPQPAELSRELQCLAGAVYFEAKSESLAGQLAVGRVVVARSKSGRFPNSYCGVVYQPSQFSFVRGSSMPRINRASQDWHDAVAIAQIAHAGTWRSPVEGALYFHAAYVSPGWHLRRVGRVENHIFYR
jgi:N-acetylmuramoyl-L-alanine amidase